MWRLRAIKFSKYKGFTLLEILLVLAVMSALSVLALSYTLQKLEEIRRDKVTLQIQQILNAGMAYYVNNGKWPLSDPTCAGTDTNLDILQKAGYLPAGPDPSHPVVFNNPWGMSFSIGCNAQTQNFTVTTDVKSNFTAKIVSGRLPFSLAPTDLTTTTVTAQVNIPGQNLNNARSVNFASIYHFGACVPAPKCPGGKDSQGNDNMIPQIMVIPVSISGVAVPGSGASYNLQSFTAYAVGGSGANANKPAAWNQVVGCSNPTQTVDCQPGPNGNIDHDPNAHYWRVCAYVLTEKGPVVFAGTTSNVVALMAVTRCSPKEEPAGSDFSVYTP